MRLVLFTALVVALLLSGLASVLAHDWYPVHCCSGQDCAPVDRAEMVAGAAMTGALQLSPLPLMLVTTKHGTAVVPPNFVRQESPDHQLHACMRKRGDTMELICLFVPPSS